MIPEKKLHRLPSWRELVIFDLFLLALLILATRLATFLHEFVGHALLTLIFGGEIKGIRISLLGGGRVFWHFGTSLAVGAGFLVAFGGILVNLLSGLPPLRWMYRPDAGPARALFPPLFSLVSLLGAVAYAALGFYYRLGDPVAWMEDPLPVADLLWLPFALAAPVVSFLAVKAFATALEGCYPARTLLRRSMILLLTLGIAGGTYAGLYVLTQQRSMAMDTPILAYQRAEKEILEQKRDRLYRAVREAHPDWSDQEIRRMVERIPVRVEPGEVPRKLPLKPVLALLFALGAFPALRRLNPVGPPGTFSLPPRTVVFTVLLALAVLGVLGWTEGWVYGPS